MAGSYSHILDENGDLVDNERFVNMIDDLGDAYEMAQEMHGIIVMLQHAHEFVRLWNEGLDAPNQGTMERELREACKHVRYEPHMSTPISEWIKEGWCEGGRILTNAEALRTLLFDVCGKCGGDSEEWCDCAHHVPGDTVNGCLGREAKRTCPACGGSGRTPKDGVRKITRTATAVWPGEYVIPASMLEGESDVADA